MKKVKGQFVWINGEHFYEIANYDQMKPFFISLASDTDLWMYLSSTGGLTCGRRSPGEALFPYYTDDKITESYEFTGPKTKIIVEREKTASLKEKSLWIPFSNHQQPVYRISRKMAKATVGNQIVFCEENHTLGLRFSYLWAPAGKHGWVRRATLENLTKEPVRIHLTDMLQNVLPAGVERKTQNEFSTLVDGYKKTELVPGTSLALFRMEAILVDRAEPSESLTCNTVYALGLPRADYSQTESKGVRGAYVARSSFNLQPSSSQTWYNVLDVSKDAVAVHELMHFIATPKRAIKAIEKAMRESTDALIRIVHKNDGIQFTGDEANDARHFANVLFNTMRGGYYLDAYQINAEAFRHHVQTFNTAVYARNESFLAALPESISRNELEKRIEELGDPQMIRLFMEYLPITFGRRHGDPSRPWNLFNIRVQDENGRPIVSYQGNWRDIFQNWEALSFTYPGYINGIISKFLNASTADGYNPYKITSEGIEWEVIEPENPWSNIGYWGDHQIIYLLKLLELSYQHDPEALRAMLGKKLFASANVPYRFKSFKEIKADSKNTIRFDDDLHKRIFEMIPAYGQDARLVLDDKNEVLLTTLEDKLFTTLLTKLSNFVPEAGIWMNTLRPEWNDANNALVGNGASMVTLCYLRRYVQFLKTFLNGKTIYLALNTAKLLYDIEACIRIHIVMQQEGHRFSRFKFTTGVGEAGEDFRKEVYNNPTNETFEFEQQDYMGMLDDMLYIIDESIRANKREDGLYNAYNLIQFKHVDAKRWEEDEVIEVSHLYPMLEGQVAVLSSGLLSPEESADLLDAMQVSDLYREDQQSYMLYPNRRRKTFLELNNLPEEAKSLPVVQKYLGSILKQDRDGGIHFDARFRNANELPDELKDLYESVFNHHAFTGRSGTFYKYEGLGCIYWHMVSKLLLAVGEVIQRTDINDPAVPRLLAHYMSIRGGIGSHKRPDEYGAFPFDPYSHTPSMAGVQQPGMTGQVKEDIISRWFELGLSVQDGQITFCPRLILPDDFIGDTLHFDYCGTHITYHLKIAGEPQTAYLNSAKVSLTKEQSAHIFARDGQITDLELTICVK